MATTRRIPGRAISRLLFVASLLNFAIVAVCQPAPELPKRPADLQTAKIDYGKADFAKETFDRYPDLGLITDFRYDRFDNGAEFQLAVVGTEGAAFVGPDQRIKKTIHFAVPMLNPVTLLMSKDSGVPVFLGRGGSWLEGVRLFDQNGAVLWDYGSFWGINGSAGGDVNGDGKLEFAVGLNGGGGIRLLDMQGHELWSKFAGNVWHVEVAPAGEHPAGEIIHSNADGALTVRNGSGEVLLTCRPTDYVSSFGLTRWASEPQPRHLMIPAKDVIIVIDLRGHQTAQLEAPGCVGDTMSSATGTPVCFSSRRCYQATLVGYSLWDRSVLYLNDQTGKIAYREVFDHRCAAVGTIPATPGSKDDSLLVGCAGEVWKYGSVGGRVSTTARD